MEERMLATGEEIKRVQLSLQNHPSQSHLDTLLYEIERNGEDAQALKKSLIDYALGASARYNNRLVDLIGADMIVLSDQQLRGVNKKLKREARYITNAIERAATRQKFACREDSYPIDTWNVHLAYHGAVTSLGIQWTQIAEYYDLEISRIGYSGVHATEVLDEWRITGGRPIDCPAIELFGDRMAAVLDAYEDLVKYDTHLIDESEKGNFVFPVQERIQVIG